MKIKMIEKKEEYNPKFYEANGFETNWKVKEVFQKFSCFDNEKLELLKQDIKIAGRVMRIRDFGKITFFLLRTFDGDIQIVLQNTSNNLYSIKVGDLIGVKGLVFKTKKGELSVKVDYLKILSKCLKNLPDMHYGFKDIEERFRNRHIDFIFNSESKEVIISRSKIIKEIRNYFDEKGFIEVETPILVSEASGAQAKPFVTYHNKLNSNFNLRIATEIPLKTLIVGGFEKIYEIGRVFRNEGIDARHNPEFTTIEIYEAYKDCSHMIFVAENLIKKISEDFQDENGFVVFGDKKIDLRTNFSKISMSDSIKKFTGIDFSKIENFEQAKDLASKKHIHVNEHQKTVGHIMNLFFENFVEHNLLQPTFIYNYPIETSPLAKSLAFNSLVADRFELFINGLEFANGYSELNDPFEQELRFENQTKEKDMGNEEVASFDENFVESLRYGMPPTAGLGIGIDRIIMLMTNKLNIREVIAFPQMKKKNL